MRPADRCALAHVLQRLDDAFGDAPVSHRAARIDPDRLPDPFGGVAVPLCVTGQAYSGPPVRGRADLQGTLDSAVPERLTARREGTYNPFVTRVFVVEDDRDIAALVAHYLEKAGWQTQVFGSGADALAAARQTPPDVAILDLMLPGMDGLEVCRALRAEPSTAGVPVIMVTARAEETDRIVGLEIGADDYIAKPFSPNELVARVRPCCDERSGRPPPCRCCASARSRWT